MLTISPVRPSGRSGMPPSFFSAALAALDSDAAATVAAPAWRNSRRLGLRWHARSSRSGSTQDESIGTSGIDRVVSSNGKCDSISRIARSPAYPRPGSDLPCRHVQVDRSAYVRLGLLFLLAWCARHPGGCRARAPERRFPSSEGWKPLFNGKDLDGWKFRNPTAKKVWVACDDVRLDPAEPARLLPVGKGGWPRAALLCGDDGRGSDIMTAEDFYDYQLHLEFTVPKGSNSGVYNRGLFEIQVFDSFGVPKPAFHDCGALYERAIPRENLAKPPGEWQSFDITMKGKQLSLSGTASPSTRTWTSATARPTGRLRAAEPGERRQARRPCRSSSARRTASTSAFSAKGGTRSGLDGPDRPGPILLQGDHGPVAYRNLYIRRLDR